MKKHILMASVAVMALGLATPALAGEKDERTPEMSSAATENNYSKIEQINTSLTDLNRAIVEQTATSATNDSQIYQNGSNNLVGVAPVAPATEYGAGVIQGGTDSTTNLSIINQGTAATTDTDGNTVAAVVVSGNKATATQNGAGNTNKSSISQQSGGNTATVRQGDTTTSDSDGSGSNTNTSWIDQGATGAGAGNEATVDQGGSEATNYSDIKQTGSTGKVTVEQDGTGYNTSFIQQSGDTDTATVKQHGGDNYSDIIQTGDSAKAEVTQNETTANTSYITQGGVGDEAYVTQSGALMTNYSSVSQSGTGAGYAKVTQQ